MRIAAYLATRFTTLVPPFTKPENPFRLLRMLNRQQTALFIVSFLAWTWDYFDFSCVSFNVIDIGHTFQKSTADVTWGITVTLLLRPVGAIIFGLAGDRFDRKWPLIINVLFYAVIEISTGFCTTYAQFIGVRALFGIAMGGIYGNAAATALEDAPIRTRGILSGLLQEGSTLGFMLAAGFNLAITPNQPYGWRALFWFGGGPPLLIALWRIYLPETQTFLRNKEARAAITADETNQHTSSAKTFLATALSAVAHHWPTLIYLVLLMAGFGFLSHGGQDLYPTFLTSQLKFSPGLVTGTMIIANCGGLIGSTLGGYFSTFFGRRLSIIVLLMFGAALIPAYILPRDSTIIAGAFFEQLFVVGAAGVLPIYLTELSPEELRSLFVGSALQLGNMIAAASSTIEATAAEHFPLQTSSTNSGQNTYDYAKVIGIFLACSYIYVLIVVLLGPEKTNNDETKVHRKSNNAIQPTTTDESEIVPEK